MPYKRGDRRTYFNGLKEFLDGVPNEEQVTVIHNNYEQKYRNGELVFLPPQALPLVRGLLAGSHWFGLLQSGIPFANIAIARLMLYNGFCTNKMIRAWG